MHDPKGTPGSRERPCWRLSTGRLAALAFMSMLAIGRALAEPPAPEPLEPAWSWSPAAGIEWVSAAGSQSQYAVAATRDAHLYIFDAQRGPLPSQSPLAVGPGIALAEGDADTAPPSSQPTSTNASAPPSPTEVVFCFDRFRVHALRLGHDPDFLWHAVVGPRGFVAGNEATTESNRMYRGDPEELRRIVAVRVTEWGVLVADDAGHLALLERLTGQVRWEQPCAETVDLRLHVRSSAAAVLWKDVTRLAGLLIDIPTGRSRRIMTAAEAPWPGWAAPLDSELLLAYAGHIALLKLPGGEELWRAERPSPILAATLHPFRFSAGATTAPATEHLLFGRMDGHLDALNLATGKMLWSVADAAGRAPPWDVLRVTGSMVCTSTGGTLALRAADTGRARFELDGAPSDRVLHFTVAPPAASVLWLAAQPDGARLQLADYELPPVAASTAPVHVQPQHVHDVGPADAFVGAIFNSGRLLVATRSELRAYVLP